MSLDSMSIKPGLGVVIPDLEPVLLLSAVPVLPGSGHICAALFAPRPDSALSTL